MKISKYRAEIMGTAILFIMIFHSTFTVKSMLIAYVKEYLQFGVDLFLLVSGLGCAYSLRLNSDVIQFYKKRVARIFIPYIVVIAVWMFYSVILMHQCTIYEYLHRYSLITFYIRGILSEWYIAAILVLYLIAPLLHRLSNKIKIVFIVMLLIISLVINLSHISFWGLQIVNEMFIVRIPSFIIGMMFIDMPVRKLCRIFNWGGVPFSVLLLIVIYYLIRLRVEYSDSVYFVHFIMMLMALPAASMLCDLYQFLEKGRGRVILSILRWLGGITLEIYLVHEKVIEFLETFLPKFANLSVFLNVVAIMVSLAVAYCVSKLGRWCLTKILVCH